MLDEDPLLMLPGPTALSENVLQAMCKQMINHRGEEFHEIFKSVQEKLKKVFCTKNDIAVLTASGTGAVEAAIRSFFKPGDEIILPNYGYFCQRAEKIAEKIGITVKSKLLPIGSTPSEALIEELLDENMNAKGIFIIYNETSTGVTVRQLREICLKAKKRGLITIIDAVSILGGDYLFVDDWKIDICIAGSQKCLATPPGISLVSVSEGAQQIAEKIDPCSVYLDVMLHVQWLRERNETPFTPAVPLIYALNVSLNQILMEGLKNRIKRHRLCAEAIYRSLEEMGLALLAEKESRSNTVIAVKYPSKINDKSFRSYLKSRYSIEVAGGIGKLHGKIFRIGCMGNVNASSVLRTVSGLSLTLNKLGYINDSTKAIEVADGILSALKIKNV